MVFIPFRRYAEKCDAIGLLRDTITELAALDLALAVVAVDAGVAEAGAGAVAAACQAGRSVCCEAGLGDRHVRAAAGIR